MKMIIVTENASARQRGYTSNGGRVGDCVKFWPQKLISAVQAKRRTHGSEPGSPAGLAVGCFRCLRARPVP